MREIGYGLQLQYDQTDGSKVIPDQVYRYIPGIGAFRESEEYKVGIVVHGSSLIALNEGSDFDRKARRELKILNRALIYDLLDGRELSTRKFFSDISKNY